MRKRISIVIMPIIFMGFHLWAEEQGLAVKAGTLYVGTGEVVKNAVLLIQQGKILEVGVNLKIPSGYHILDFSHRVVLPGLVDAHSHVGEMPFPEDRRSSDLNESSSSLTPMVDIRDSLNFWSPTTFDNAVAAGVTTVMAIPGSFGVIGGVGTILKTSGEDIERRILRPQGLLKMALGMNPKLGGKNNNAVPKTRMGVRYLMWKSFDEAREYKAEWDKYKEDPQKNKKPDLDMAKEPLRKALEREMPVHIHCARADDIITACNLGRDFNLDFSLGHVYEGHLVAEELARRGVPVVTGPLLSGWRYGRNEDVPANVTGKMAEAGVKVAIMTDAIDWCDLLLQVSYAVKLGMDEIEAVKAITINAAEICHVEDRVGSLEAGKDGDFVVLDGEPFEVTTRILAVFIEGQSVFEDTEKEI